jgi:hypothetical protein
VRLFYLFCMYRALGVGRRASLRFVLRRLRRA